ncbi:hypothetical protein HaLaN_31992 [Haematococcus lacustris]|uniref:Uncharacterized protein n=1 Tax=Haematococcus lacustris TaxID=44745 RepID=A0A6A0AIY8_HAELA|nr:hypothetical protein HaLaN_31992 [Haematococcus lacustris]
MYAKHALMLSCACLQLKHGGQLLLQDWPDVVHHGYARLLTSVVPDTALSGCVIRPSILALRAAHVSRCTAGYPVQHKWWPAAILFHIMQPVVESMLGKVTGMAEFSNGAECIQGLDDICCFAAARLGGVWSNAAAPFLSVALDPLLDVSAYHLLLPDTLFLGGE